MANIEINDIQLTMNHMARKDPDDVVTLDFIARDDEGSVRVNLHSERGHSAFVTIVQDEKGVYVIVENDERETTTARALTWEDDEGDEESKLETDNGTRLQ